MGYMFVLASFVPPQSGGMIPFSYKHYHHDITSRYDKIIVVVVVRTRHVSILTVPHLMNNEHIYTF